MQIIYEARSFNGNIKVKEVICSHFYPKDNVRIKDGHEQDVIICKLVKKGTVSIAFFGSTGQRDLALKALKRSSSSLVFLDYNDYFCYEAWEDDVAIKVCKQNFGNFTLPKCINLQISRGAIADVHNSDAFKSISPLFIDAMEKKRPYFIENPDQFSRLWAKCLWTPSLVTSRGISPRQYFLYLINKNNEKFTDNNT